MEQQQIELPKPVEATFLATRDLLLKFARTPEGQQFVFHTTLGGGSKCVDRLRVALSRIRTQLNNRGKTFLRFKMLVESCKSEVANGRDIPTDRDVVVLLKIFGEDVRVSDEMKELFDELVTGEQFNDNA